MNSTPLPSFRSRYYPFSLSSFALLLCLAAGFLSVDCGGEVPPSPTAEGDPLNGERINNFYTNEEIRYFLDVAIGDSNYVDIDKGELETIKWLEDIRIEIDGHPTAKDSIMVQRVAAQLKRIVPQIDISITDYAPNVHIYFVPPDQFHLVEPTSQPGDPYQAWVYWLGGGAIYRASIMIPDSSSVSQYERDPMILSNMVAILGLLHRSMEHEESIFYFWWNGVTELAPIDRVVIELLYSPEILPGMRRGQAVAALTNRS